MQLLLNIVSGVMKMSVDLCVYLQNIMKALLRYKQILREFMKAAKEIVVRFIILRTNSWK